MIKIYTVASCSSCKKAKEWLEKQNLAYQEINLVTSRICKEDILEILALTEEGTGDIISRRSQAYQRLNIDFETIKLNDLIQIIEENPTLLRRPLIVDHKRLQVGYNDDEIRKFLPRKKREIQIKVATEASYNLDIEEQFQYVKSVIRNKKCYVTLEVLAEVCYVLEGLYQVSREDIVHNFRKLNNDITILNADVVFRALEIFDKTPKLDFVDCLLYGYQVGKGLEIITFDKKLQKRLEMNKL